MSEVVTEIRGMAGLITLDRPRAMNALSLDMIRGLTATLLAWAGDTRVQRVAVRAWAGKGLSAPSARAATSASFTRRSLTGTGA